MAKRKLTSLRSVLLRYLLLCGGGCALILVLWWGIFMQLINIGFLLPAVASAQACADARETVASMTADTFDSLQISDLCRWAVVQNDTVLQTNMNDRHLKNALNAFHGGSGNLVLMQYQYDVKMADGSFCLLQYDYALPYADPALRDTLPDFQTCYIVLLAALILVWLGWQTHCTVRTFAAETARLNAAVDAIAARQLEQIDTDGVRIREFSATLQALQTMGRELTDSLQTQWRMEQQRTEQIAALTHDLKTPLTVIQGNADLLADAASALCAPAGVDFHCEEHWQGHIRAAEDDLRRAVENLLENAVNHTPRGGTVTLTVAREGSNLRIRVTDTGPGFTPEALAKAGEMLYTDAARSDAAHQGLGLYFAKKVAQFHGGTLVLSNLSGTHGACAELRLPIGR